MHLDWYTFVDRLQLKQGLSFEQHPGLGFDLAALVQPHLKFLFVCLFIQGIHVTQLRGEFTNMPWQRFTLAYLLFSYLHQQRCNV